MIRTKQVFIFSLSMLFVLAAVLPSAAQKTNTVIRSESRLVLVDTVVTDKRGYVKDLTQQDFRVFEDGKEQPIKSFSFETTPDGKAREQYVALFFANAYITPVDEARIRDAAVKLVEANAATNRYFAVINFGTILRVTQNFTSNPDLIIPAVQGRYLGLSGQVASLNSDSVPQVEGDFAAGSVLQGLRSLARGMSKIQGRKTVIFLTAGFPLASEKYYELQAAIDACNRANVAVYPLDVRGLKTTGKGADTSSELIIPEKPQTPRWTDGVLRSTDAPVLQRASFRELSPAAPPEPPQRPGMLGTYIPDANRAPANRRPPPPVADVTKEMSNPQSVMYALAESTGGFVIVNTNDLLAGMQKITQEQNAYYMLGFVPPASPEGSCHRLKVKVERSGTQVRARNTYCTVRPVDLLAGDPVEKQLEDQMEVGGGGTKPPAVSASAPFFYTSPNTARVNLVLDIPASVLNLESGGGKFRKEFNILGIAYKQDGSVAARFSDALKLDLDKKEAEALRHKPFHYEKQFLIASGNYQLKIVLGSGASVIGMVESPLTIEPYDSKVLGMSAVYLTNELVDLTRNQQIVDQAMLQDKALLAVDGMQFVPSATNRFKRTDQTLMYVEIYEPLLLDHPSAGLNVRYRVLDLNTGATVMDTGMFTPNTTMRPGFPVVPLGLKLLADKLQPGSYRLIVQATNAAGQTSPSRTTDFDVE